MYISERILAVKYLSILFLIFVNLFANEINVNVTEGRIPISPYIYGKNNCLSDNPGDPLNQAEWQILKDAGVRIVRETGGNNSTKYNWRKKLTSHPDWYNNVYKHDWDYTAKSLQDNLPSVQGLFAFQLIGWAAKTSSYNFNDWEYNRSQWWEGTRNNWAGGGGPDKGDSDPQLYLEEWPPEETVGILDQWFGVDGIGLDKNQFLYWNMDNEPEVWMGTHDDVMPTLIPAEDYMQRFFQIAKLAREKFPEIKIMGPVSTNEWQWYNWDDNKISYKGKRYVWLEYFILRLAEEQQTSGTKLLDVIDLHFYPYETSSTDIVNLHRVWFDKNYNYPGANGVKRAGSSEWDGNIRKEYIFQRCLDWLEKYMGADHDVKLGITEMGIGDNNANVTAVWYASTLGVFADNKVEIFTPWSWKAGMWEVLHLFSRYGKTIRVSSSSQVDDIVNAYASTNEAADSLTIFLVNRDTQASQDVKMTLTNFQVKNDDYDRLELANLPSSETFKSHENNALKESKIEVTNNSFELSLSKLSVTAVLLSGKTVETSVPTQKIPSVFSVKVFPNPFNPKTTITYSLQRTENVKMTMCDALGRKVKSFENMPSTIGFHTISLDASDLTNGVYFISLTIGTQVTHKKIMLIK